MAKDRNKCHCQRKICNYFSETLKLLPAYSQQWHHLRHYFSVFSIWKSLQVLQKAHIKTVACAIYTYQILSHTHTLLFCNKIRSCWDQVLTKTRDDLKWPETNWNNLQQARNNLKWLTTSKKRPEMTYNEQETTWNDLQQARNDLKWPVMSKKQPETTWNNIKQARNDLKRPTMSKTQPTMTQNSLERAKQRRKTTNNNQILRLFYNMGQSVLFSTTFST